MTAAALFAFACTPSFQSQTQVTDLRLLGIQAQPPEALFDATCTNPNVLTTCAISNVDDMQITLLYDDPIHPNAIGIVTPTLCAPSTATPANPICGADSLALLQQEGPQTQLSFSLFAALAANNLQLLPALIAASAESSELMGFGGIEVELQLGVDTGDPNGIQLGHKTLVFNQRLQGGNPYQ
jgi:hypothetical protein